MIYYSTTFITRVNIVEILQLTTDYASVTARAAKVTRLFKD